MKQITIVNRSRANVVGTRIEVADTFFTRLVGLLGRRQLHADSGLLIQPSSGVHTFGMLFPIDVVALDRKFRVIAVWPNLRPWRTSSVNWKTHAVWNYRAAIFGTVPSKPATNWKSRRRMNVTPSHKLAF